MSKQHPNTTLELSRTDAGLKRPTRDFLAFVLIALSIMALLSLYYVAKHKAFAFVDIGTDLFFQFYPLQVAEARQLRELHDLTWSFNIGLGGYIGTAFDPVQLFSALFPDSWQLGLRLPLYFAKLLLGGSFFFSYLRKLGFASRLSIFGALGFTFSSYEMINGQWDENAFVAVQFAAYLVFFETYLREKKTWAAIAAGFVVGFGEAFDVYTFSLLTALYTPARLLFLSGGSYRTESMKLLRFASWAALGFLLAAPIQFPHLYYLFDSPRISGNHSALNALVGQMLKLNDLSTIFSEVAGFFGKDLLGTGSSYAGWANYFEGPGFYVGLLPLLCIPQLVGPAASQKERRLFWIGLVLLALYILWPALRYAVYGFGHIAFRLSTLWVSAALIVTGLAGLRRALESGTWRWGLIIGTIGIFAAIAMITALLPASVSIGQLLRLSGFSAIYAAILWRYDAKVLRFRLLEILLAISACELLLFSAPAMIDRVAVNSDGRSEDGVYSYDDGTVQALDAIRRHDISDEFYRIEKTFNSVFLCDALLQNYAGVKSYFFHGAAITKFVDRLAISRPTPSVSYIGSAVDRPGILDLVGVKYLLSRDRSLDASMHFSFVETVGGINVYVNNTAHGFGTLYDTIISEAEVEATPNPERDAILLSKLVVVDTAVVKQHRVDTSNLRSETNSQKTAHFKKIADDKLEGVLASPTASFLLLSMPFDKGWTADLDGHAVDLFDADYGLTAAAIPAGAHSMTLKYVPPGRTLGLWCSIGAFFILLGFRFRKLYWKASPAPRHILRLP